MPLSVSPRTSTSSRRSPTPDVLYICYEFPRLSETFIANEFLELRRSGVGVAALALYPADAANLTPVLKELAAETLCVARPRLATCLAALAWSLRTRPARTLRALTYLTRGEAPPRRWAAYASHLLYACHVVRTVDLGEVALFHAHFAAGPANVAMFLGLLTGKPYTVVAHAYDIYQDRMALRLKLETAAAFVTISEANRDWLIRRYGGAARSVRVIHCGVELGGGVDAAPAGSSDPPLILAVGRLTPKKGHDVLLRACATLRDRGIGFRCVIVGDGELRQELEALVRTLHLKERVHLAGALSHDETLAMTSSAAIAALACRQLADGSRDGIPVSLMEAMAMGVPAVSTRVSGIPELVRDGESGLLVEQDDPGALADALADLLGNEERRRTLGSAAHLAVLREFDLAETTRTMRTLLEAVAPALRGARPGPTLEAP